MSSGRQDTDNTTTPPALEDPSAPAPPGAASVVWVLVIVWSRDEPHRVGEHAPLTDSHSWVLGRGSMDSPYPRVQFRREMPGAIIETKKLVGDNMSREQCKLTQRAAGIEIVNAGMQTKLVVDGKPVDRAFLRDGGVFSLAPFALRPDADVRVLPPFYVFLLTTRPRVLPLTDYPPPHAFGEIDAHGILGESPAAWNLRAQIAMAAKSPRHALVTGDSGTGKELAAAAIHALSPRVRGRFVARNAATLPPGLIAAELFGNIRNFPNAGMPERPGLVGEANGGTLFLDEIAEMPMETQPQLLRVLDAGEYQSLGDSKVCRANLRVIGATNRDVSSLKHDLAARLTTRVAVPSLDARREDIPLLARHLVLKHAAETPEIAERFVMRGSDGREYARFDAEVIEALVKRPYATNVRELDRLLWDAICATTDDTLRMTDELRAPPKPGLRKTSAELPDPEGLPVGDVLAGVGRSPSEADLRASLIRHDGVIARVARELGMSRPAVYRLMVKYGIKVESEAL